MNRWSSKLLLAAWLACVVPGEAANPAPRVMENLGRGVMAVLQGDGRVFVGWRILGTDPEDVRFNVYRAEGNAAPARLNPEPLAGPTFFIDPSPKLAQDVSYSVRAIIDGAEQPPGAGFKMPAHSRARPYLSVPLQTPAGYSPNDASVGDLDGDGEYGIVLHQTGRSHDNARAGETDSPILQACGHSRRLARGSDLAHRRQPGAAHLHHHHPHQASLPDADARPAIPSRHRLAEHLVQPAAAPQLLSR